MRLGRPKVALILTDDERVRLDSLAHRSRTAPHLARRAWPPTRSLGGYVVASVGALGRFSYYDWWIVNRPSV
jgi:hypothetical protein